MDILSGSAIDVFSLPGRCFVRLFCAIFFQVDQFRHFVRKAFCENRGILDLIEDYFGTSYKLLGLDSTFGLL